MANSLQNRLSMKKFSTLTSCNICLAATKESRKKRFIVFEKNNQFYISFKEEISDLNRIFGKYKIILIK